MKMVKRNSEMVTQIQSVFFIYSYGELPNLTEIEMALILENYYYY